MPDTDATLALLNARLGNLHEDVGEMKAVLQRLTDAITKLALIEQQQAQTAHAMERAFSAIEKVEARTAALEQKMPDAARASAWVDRAVWAAAAAAAMFVAAKSGLFGG